MSSLGHLSIIEFTALTNFYTMVMVVIGFCVIAISLIFSIRAKKSRAFILGFVCWFSFQSLLFISVIRIKNTLLAASIWPINIFIIITLLICKKRWIAYGWMIAIGVNAIGLTIMALQKMLVHEVILGAFLLFGPFPFYWYALFHNLPWI